MSLSSNFITSAQQDLAAMLAADEALQNVRVVREAARERNGGVVFEDAVNRALDTKTAVNGRCGLAVIVFSPEGKPESRANTGLTSRFEIPVRVVENPQLNTSRDFGTNVSCEDMLVEVMLLIQNWSPVRGRPFRVGEFYKVPLDKQPHLWAWECIVETMDAQTGREKCGLPQVVVNQNEGGSQVTITTSTAEALIYFSLDGSLPTPATGQLYAAGLDITAPCTLRAMAWREGMMPSDCATISIP